MNKTDSIRYRLYAIIPMLAVSLLCFWLSFKTAWTGDAIAYQFFAPSPDSHDISYDRIESINQIWQSQVNNYRTTNGRFFCHYLVQVFLGLLPKFWFAIANSLVWLLFMFIIARMAGLSITNRYAIQTSTAVLFWLAGWHLKFDPPIQINYIWMGAITFIWIYLFIEKNKSNWWQIPLWAIFSFLAGEGNESFSIPIGGAIIIWFIICRGQFTKWQWIGAIAFGAGSLVLCLAPGNFVRLENPDLIFSNRMSFLSFMIKSLSLSLFIPCIVLTLFIFNRLFRENIFKLDKLCKFLLFTIITSLILCVILRFRGGERMLYIDVIAFIVILLRNIKELQVKGLTIVIAAIIVLCVPVTATATYIKIHRQSMKYDLIRELYHNSDSGIVVIPDDIYAIDDIGGKLMYTSNWTLIERSKNPSKQWIKIYPVSLSKIDFQSDTNLCIPFMKQGWIMIQSRKKPANFNIKKTFLPSITEKCTSTQQVDFSLKSDILVDTTAHNKIAIYINHLPTIFCNVEVHMQDLYE